MSATEISAALQRAQSVLLRRPSAGLHEDAPATARWSGGTRMVAHHPNGAQVQTDMPIELGGTGDQVSPGWLMRAGFASCTATLIAMVAAERGMALESVDVTTSSQSDTRGLLGMSDADGTPVPAGPGHMQTVVRVSVRNASAEDARALVDEAYRRSPIACAVQGAVPVALRVDVDVLKAA